MNTELAPSPMSPMSSIQAAMTWARRYNVSLDDAWQEHWLWQQLDGKQMLALKYAIARMADHALTNSTRIRLAEQVSLDEMIGDSISERTEWTIVPPAPRDDDQPALRQLLRWYQRGLITQREVDVLAQRLVDGRKWADVSKALHMSQSHAKALYAQAIKRLREADQ